jgi:hypothetical protein
LLYTLALTWGLTALGGQLWQAVARWMDLAG